MKRYSLIVFCLIVFSIHHLYAQKEECLKECLKDTLIKFLISKNDLTNDSFSHKTFLIINDIVNLTDINKQEYGIFKFGTLTSHSYFHILIKDKNSYNIVDMKQPFENVISILIEYFQDNNYYNREEILNYMKRTTELYKVNQEAVPWKI